MIADMPSGLSIISRELPKAPGWAIFSVPFLRKFIAHDLRNHQRIMKRKKRSWLDDSGLKGPRLDILFFLLFDTTSDS